MPRPRRNDSPGALYHVFNRSVGRRPLFDSAADMRRFEHVLSDVVDGGALGIHAYCLMTTHYHLLAESPVGHLDLAMHDLQGNYARWFNETCDRQGPLFRRRYVAKRITDTHYRDAVLWYIDRNPVEARLVDAPGDYPYGSAFHYRHPPGPRWLTRSLVESIAAARNGGRFDPGRYGLAGSGGAAATALWRLMDRVSMGPGESGPALSALFGARPEHIQRWLDENARKADGIVRRAPLAAPETLVAEVARVTARTGELASLRDAASSLLVGLLYEFGGEGHAALAARTGLSLSCVRQRLAAHRARVESSTTYRTAAAEVIRSAAGATYAPL